MNPDTTHCPYCKETIMRGATKCKHCKSEIDLSYAQTSFSENQETLYSDRRSTPNPISKTNSPYLIFIVLAVIVLVVTNPSKQDFQVFIRNQIAEKINQDESINSNPLAKGIVSGLGSVIVNSISEEKSYGLFSIHTLDFSFLSYFGQDAKRMSFLGILGNFIPLNSEFWSNSRNEINKSGSNQEQKSSNSNNDKNAEIASITQSTSIERKPDVVQNNDQNQNVRQEPSKAESSVPISQEDEQLRRQQEEASAAEQRARKRREEIQKLNQLAGDGVAGDAEKSQGPRGDNRFARKIAGLIKSHTILPQNDIAGNPSVEFLIELQPDGGLRGEPKMTKSSGFAAFDQAVKRAIENSVPFPQDPSTGKVPSSINITHRLKDSDTR